MRPISIYIHIPFCKEKCYYCDFTSFAHREEQFSSYVDSLCREIKGYEHMLQEVEVQTLFIGGGTPTILPPAYIHRIMEQLYISFKISPYAEISVESNPGTVTKHSLHELRSSGINRLSIGLQAWQNSLLTKLGRIHTVEQFLSTYHDAREAGMTNINIDLMFSLPDQSLQQWEETLAHIIKLQPEHISCYSLIIEEHTITHNQYKNGLLELPTEDIDRQMYRLAVDMLQTAGYTQYEISNFSKPGYDCRHNIVYWQTDEYIGLGLGSHSYYDHIRFHNTYDLSQYLKSSGSILLREEEEPIDIQSQYEEYMFLGLRLTQGISAQDFHKRFEISLDSIYGSVIKKMIKQNLIKQENGRIKLTNRGIDVSNRVFQEFLLK